MPIKYLLFKNSFKQGQAKRVQAMKAQSTGLVVSSF